MEGHGRSWKANLAERLLKCLPPPYGQALIVLEAEMQRMTIYPRHLAEAAWLLRLDAAKRNPAMRRRADTLIPGNTALRVNREEHSLGTALSLSHAALGMALDELEPHRAADAAARAACAATIEQRAAELRAATKGYEPTASAIDRHRPPPSAAECHRPPPTATECHRGAHR